MSEPNEITLKRRDPCTMCGQSIHAEENLKEANRKLETVSRAVDISEKICDASTDKQVELSCTFDEAIAYITLEQTEKERDAALARVKVLEEALKEYKSRCPNCGGQGWYPTYDGDGNEQQQAQCEWCDLAIQTLSPQEG